MANEKDTQMAAEILAAVGGAGNVATVTHCMTRLRFHLKDEALSSDEQLQKVTGVISVVHAGGQVQVVVGQGVDRVYDEVCKAGSFGAAPAAPAANEKQDAPKEKLTPKKVLNNVLGALSGSITPILPVFIVAGIFKMVAVLLGPGKIGLLTEENELYVLCNLVNDACFYFLPFFAAFSAAKKFNTNPIMAMVITAIMLHPDMLSIVTAGEGFKIYGLFPMMLVNYTQAVIPVILITWVLSYVERWVKKIMPNLLRTLGIPVLTMVIMLPLAFCVFGPLCNVVMGWIANAIIWLNDTVGILAMVIVGALWTLIISFGMHVPIMTTLLPTWMLMGYDAIVTPASLSATMAGLGVQLAYALRSDGPENKSLGWSCFTTNALANIGEPYIYGIYLRDKRAMLWHMIGGASGALVMGVLGAKVYIFSGVGFPWLNFLRFGEDAVKGGIGMVVAFTVSLILGFIFGFEKKQAQ